MPQIVRICSQAELPGPGEAREFTAEDAPFCVANVGGAIAVLDNFCPHDGGPLGQGFVEEGRVVCPWHAYAFDPRTGAAKHNPNVKARVFDSFIEEGELRIRV